MTPIDHTPESELEITPHTCNCDCELCLHEYYAERMAQDKQDDQKEQGELKREIEWIVNNQ
jgi:hypothetical protein